MHDVNRADWYDKNPKAPDTSPSVKIAPKAKGELADGYSKVATPAESKDGHMQTKSDRDKVGSPWSLDSKHTGKASPANHADVVKVKANHEYRAK